MAAVKQEVFCVLDSSSKEDDSSDSLPTSIGSSDDECAAVSTLLLLHQKRYSQLCSKEEEYQSQRTSCSQPAISDTVKLQIDRNYSSDAEVERTLSGNEYSRKRKIYKYVSERERRENKRDQNKEAAKRYREKKKTEAEMYHKEMSELEAINRKCRQMIKELEHEKQMLIQKLRMDRK